MGFGGNGSTIDPPGDGSSRRPGDGGVRLRLVTEPRPARKGLPPESAPFDPELDTVELAPHDRGRRRSVRIAPRTSRSRRRAARADGLGLTGRMWRAVRLGAAQRRLSIVALVLALVCFAVAGVLAEAPTAPSRFESQRRSETLRIPSETSSLGSANSRALTTGNPFAAWRPEVRPSKRQGRARAAKHTRPPAPRRKRDRSGPHRADTVVALAAGSPQRTESSSVAATSSVRSTDGPAPSPVITAPSYSPASSPVKGASTEASGSAEPAGPVGTGGGTVNGNCNPKCR